MNEIKPKRTRRYFMAECECGWVDDGFGEEHRARLERLRAEHQKGCPTSITRITSSITKVWNPRPG